LGLFALAVWLWDMRFFSQVAYDSMLKLLGCGSEGMHCLLFLSQEVKLLERKKCKSGNSIVHSKK
jgi:hypothetical protein